MSADRVYVSVLGFPADMTARERVVALSESLGIDEYSVEVTHHWATPGVLKVCGADEAERMVRTLEELGIPAYGVRQAGLDQLGEPAPAKRLSAALGAPTAMYAHETHRPRLFAPGSLVMHDVFAMISGRVRERYSIARTLLPRADHASYVEATGAERTAGTSAGGGSGGLIGSLATDRYVLDLHLKDRRCVRIDSGAFNFDFLEGKLGCTDRENYQRLIERFRAEAPGAIFDEGFAEFRPPPNIATSQSRAFGDASVTALDSGPAFDFYSAWKFLVLEYVRSRSVAAN